MTGFRIELYGDGADPGEIRAARQAGLVSGFTTNPTLMKKCGATDYEKCARAALEAAGTLPISLEVFADEFDEMERQARLLTTWGENVYVKIPITNTRAESSVPLIKRLNHSGIKLNITAILTLPQVRSVVDVLSDAVPTVVSVFAGRIADTGRDPVPLMREAAAVVHRRSHAKLLWASPRELLNIFQAQESGSDIITVPNDILKKLKLINMPLEEMSLDTVNMFYNDAVAAGYKL